MNTYSLYEMGKWSLVELYRDKEMVLQVSISEEQCDQIERLYALGIDAALSLDNECTLRLVDKVLSFEYDGIVYHEAEGGR